MNERKRKEKKKRKGKKKEREKRKKRKEKEKEKKQEKRKRKIEEKRKRKKKIPGGRIEVELSAGVNRGLLGIVSAKERRGGRNKREELKRGIKKEKKRK